MSQSLVILLHGVGSRGADLATLGQYWQAGMPDTIFVAPDGPFPFDQRPIGRQWFSVQGVTPENRADRIVAARPAFDAVIGAIIAEHGFTDRLDRVAFAGFSQGTIMAYDAILSGRWPVAALAAFSGRLSFPAPFAPDIATKFMVIHGENDMVIPLAEAVDAQLRLRHLGAEAPLHIVKGLGHSISAEGASIAGRFLGDCLA